MASERFGTGNCLARQTSTASLISSVKPMTFFMGCVSGRPTRGRARCAQTTDHREPGGSQRCEIVLPLFAGYLRLVGDRAGSLR
jgi:hypothetical protein